MNGMQAVRNVLRAVVGTILMAAVALAGGPAAEAQKVDVRFRLDWFPKGIHSLFWTAKAKGFYDEQNLNVTIVTGDGSGNTIKLVGSGEFDFGFADGPTGVVGRSRGIPVVAIGSVHQKNPQGIVSLKETGITKPKDLEGKTFAIQPQSSTYPFWLAFARMNDIDRGKVREINTPGEVPLFILEKKVHASAVLYDNEFITIESKAGGRVPPTSCWATTTASRPTATACLPTRRPSRSARMWSGGSWPRPGRACGTPWNTRRRPSTSS
jgi:NitT/TauT family transport system substrate-binding protein